jgi:hypothetical protein
MIYFLGFYTEGPDVDGCYDLKEVCSQIKNRLSEYFTDIFLFNKNDLKKLDRSEQFCNAYEEELSMNPNANKIGYFDFKGFLISHILTKIPEGSILLYHDTNFERNPQYWQSDWSNIKNICESMLSQNGSDLFFQFEREGVYVREYVKTYTIDRLFPNETENSIVKDCILINAARMVIRNTEFSKTFINEYKELCLQKELLMKSPNPNPDNRFQWSCGDQDVLNCLIYKYILEGKFRPDFPRYSFLYRILRYENRPFMWYDRPHSTGISILNNDRLIEYMKNK